VRTRGKAAFQDGRHGHPTKLRMAERTWLESYCRASPATPSRVVQVTLQERFGIQISLGYLNQVRADLGLGSRTQEAGKKTRGIPCIGYLGHPFKKRWTLASSITPIP
jgi:transposase